MRRLEVILVVAGCAAFSAAGCSKASGGPHATGAETFTSPPPGSPSLAAGGSIGGAAPSGAAPTNSAGSPDVPRAIEEADIYKRVGSTLYVLNAYRGLEIVDISNLGAPRLAGRVPLAGTPVDLYVEGSVAFVTVSDDFRFGLAADGSMQPQRGSRFVAVDVSVPSQPVVFSDLPIDGQIETTRIVGNILYVVSHNYWWYVWGAPLGAAPSAVAAGATGPVLTSGDDTTFVASFDVTDPAHPRQVAKIDVPVGGWSEHANVTSDRVTLAVSGWDISGPRTRFQVVDISDPAGALAQGAQFSCDGVVPDRWSMDFDPVRGLFRAVVGGNWNGGAALQIWATPIASAATTLSRLSIDVAESLSAARFDGDRVYVVTTLTADPLWAVDASDPKNPVLAGSVSMPGQLDFIEPRGDRLLALGHTNEAGQPFQLAVTLLDVSTLATPKLVSRVVFGSSWSWVGAQPDEMQKAFIVLDPPPLGIGLILVPVQGFDSKSYAYVGGTQLVDFARDGLTLRGFLAHPGSVLRSFPATDDGTALAAFSDTMLQTIDASNRDAPLEKGRLDLARWVQALAVFQGKVVELSGDWYRGATELDTTDSSEPDAAPPLATFAVRAPQAVMFQDGNVAWLLAHDYTSGTAWLQAVDMTAPLHPAARGRLDLATGEAPNLGGGWWGYGDEAVLVGHSLAVHRQLYGLVPCPTTGKCSGNAMPADELLVFDLSDPDHPRQAATLSLPDSAWSWGLQAYGHFAWLTHFEWDSRSSLGKYYLDRIDLADPANPALLAKVNVPGVLAAAAVDGTHVYTLETWWATDGSAVTTYLHVLELTSAGTARLRGSAQLQGYPAGSAIEGGFAWVASLAYSQSGVSSARLTTVDLGAIAVTNEQAIEASWPWLRRAAGGKLFLQAGWADQGMLVYDLTDLSKPAFEQFFRTQGWISDVVVAGGIAYLPSGPYGVPMIRLASP